MRNLKSYNKSTIDFHDLVLTGKYTTANDPTYKDRVKALRARILEKFEAYDLLFAGKQLIKAVCAGFVDQDKADLLNLYSYKSNIIKQLKVELTTLENNRILNTCQNCTINEINSFDHFLPKDEFAELVVNPKNLFPSCTACNSFKLKAWKTEDSMLFLNLYLDDLPDIQYLFVDIEVSAADNSINTEFKVENKNGIDPDLFKLISSHYTKLHLCERFTSNRNGPIDKLEIAVNAFSKKLSRNDIIDSIEETVAGEKLAFGHNYWKAIVKQKLIHNDDFMSRFTFKA